MVEMVDVAETADNAANNSHTTQEFQCLVYNILSTLSYANTLERFEQLGYGSIDYMRKTLQFVKIEMPNAAGM